MNNADLLVKTLKTAGIARGFGVPSGNVLPLMEAMRLGGIQFVLTAHEGSAGFAADVTARMSGVPGLCIATLGPGATNLTTGVGGAYLDRSPLIAITCTLNQKQLGHRIQMWIDHQALFKPITKASVILRSGHIVAAVTEAIKLSLTEPQGPVHLDLPEDVALALADEPAPSLPPPQAPPLQRATSTMLETAADLISRAKHPIAVIGTSAMRMRNPEKLLEFIEHHQIPFMSTTMAKGLIDESHPLSLGCIERAMRKVQRKFIQNADLIIGLGYDTIEVEYEAWTGDVPVLHVDIEPVDTIGSLCLAHQVIGELDFSITSLANIKKTKNSWIAADISNHVKLFQLALRPHTAHFSPHQAIDVVRAVLPREGILAFDVGAHTHQIASQWTTYAPKTFLITNGWSSMGFGIPAAIAAKMACRELPVVCIVGDGCFQMTCGEIAVAKREGLAIPFVVLDDRWLSLIKVKQERRELDLYGTELSKLEYDDPPAHYFGVPAFGVRDPIQLERQLRLALQCTGPTVIEAVVDPSEYSITVFD